MKHSKGLWIYDSNHGCKDIRVGDQVIAFTAGLSNEEEDRANAALIAYAPEFLSAFEDALASLEWKYEYDLGNFDKADDEKLCEWRGLMSQFKKASAKNG